MNEIDQFTTELKKSGGSLVVTVPYNLVRFAGLQHGQTVKVYLKKVE